MSKVCPHCNGTGRVQDANDARQLAIQLIREHPSREVYEAGDAQGKPTGRYYITYTSGFTGLSTEQVRQLLAEGYLTQTKCPGLYRCGPKLKT